MAKASLEYHITDNNNGILEKKVIQKFYIGSKYFYALQLQATNKKNVVFSRGLLPTDGSNTVIMTDKMLLTHFGHSQTLEYYKNPIDGQDYF